MKAPAFWWRPRPGAAALLLAPAAIVYGRIAAARMRRPGLDPPLPVLCVGNFVAGGAGKTPTVIALAGLAREAGLSPAILTRGYGGRLAGPVLVEPAVHGAGDVGDEALLLARAAPTVVSRERPAAFPLLAGLGADIAIMDDGFQSPAVAKTFSLVVADGAVGIGNGLAMPAGPLRAPMAAQLPRADAVAVIGDGEGGWDVARRAARAGRPVLRARLAARDADGLRGARVFVVAGIGRPEKVHATLAEAGAVVVGRRDFPDHHPFTADEARGVLAEAATASARIVMTEKDAVRLDGAPDGPLRELRAGAHVLGVDLVPDDPARWRDLVLGVRRSFVESR